ncbi:UDP-N-acetylmuramyl-tripeptide synthetase [Candidatus Parcubacteria bacterium]|nr:UDP-N-acetylmuramyl-tripeptide synthetase [Patescibacteria group bacterium]MBU4308896.1 UDP-N-acetylmuramyl-tripeptide synthetase [Patescibacteria group bacterium]MBU4432602.1 UDP-N-acetylmuramyl-tripeptide synthetase [Patescibacteria group bacterium]MBU4577256.1 UDP-N-acetylmuramyl-tripeptide synthetase [Patescibacteria group bacterium]MCG2696947.1 UDP-N-acetylmuramyl-tripeptide synthetase [Candidatus Parcubacteria bacterium]
MKTLNLVKKLIPKKVFKALQPPYHYFMAWLAAFFYGFPSEKLIVIGVTGTTGKTTSTYLIAKTLENAGLKVGFTSTAMFHNGNREWLNDKKMTMVGRFFTQKMLRDMVRNGCQYAIVETTSEGVVQFRHRFINYDWLVFTGLYPEHIESHGSFQNYKEAKGKLFAHLKNCKHKFMNEAKIVEKADSGMKKIGLERVKKVIVANGDDDNVDYFLDFWADRKIVFTADRCLQSDNETMQCLEYGDIKVSGAGTSFSIDGRIINLRVLGTFNALNAMFAYCIGLVQGLPKAKIREGLEKIDGVAGRLERIDEGQDFVVIVDYAFEPNAVNKLYDTVELISHNKIIHVLGSTGGGRDVSRRPILGAIAGKRADIVIVTNEDPYDDDPQLIIDQVALGAENEGKKLDQNLFKIMDRGEAIKKALEMAVKDDIVLITGKGSEQAICVANGERITWDDRATARGLLNNLKKK